MNAHWTALSKTQRDGNLVLYTTGYGEPFEVVIPVMQLDRFVDWLCGSDNRSASDIQETDS